MGSRFPLQSSPKKLGISTAIGARTETIASPVRYRSGGFFRMIQKTKNE
jgi:hypothetical protein